MANNPDIPSLVSQLTLEEKISLLAGKDLWHTYAIERLNIPSLKYSDGPNGARGGLFVGGLSSACFPAGVCLAASFDRKLVREVGKALAEETRTKGASVLLGPTVCPHRDPRGGRNFESFSEDPFLAGELASEYILGLQSQGVGATIKHYAANEQETKRFTMNAQVSQRALREIYLKPFEIAVKKSDPWAMMTSYNVVNGVHADMNDDLISKTLRQEWGYKGLVMSDWGGTNSTAASLNAGLDLEMPGPTNYRTLEKVSAAIDAGEVSTDTIDKRVVTNLELLVKTAKFKNPGISDEQALEIPGHRDLIRRVGAEGMVLLKNNDSILPIKTEGLKTVALLGLAKEFLGHGGGSASVNAHRKISAFQALEEALDGTVQLRYGKGASVLRKLRPLQENIVDDKGNPGISIQVTSKGSDSPSYSTSTKTSFQLLENPELVSLVMRGTFTPVDSGHHYLSFVTVGPVKLSINGDTVFEYKTASADILAVFLDTAVEERKQYYFSAGQQYLIEIEATAMIGATEEMPMFKNPVIAFTFGFATQQEIEADHLTEAVEIAKTSDLAIVFTGHTPVWETEGTDREGINLPVDGSLDKLIAACASVNEKTIVVNSTGSPVAMPWFDEVAAVLQTWFPGQEAGYSIADVLLGKMNPCGKLPVTFPKKAEDMPTYANFPGSVSELRVEYKEDVFMGYRYYDLNPQNVLAAFGYGLSFTAFNVSEISVSTQQLKPTDTFEVSANIENSGGRKGSEILQFYVGPVEDGKKSDVERPKKILVGWEKAADLEPGESRRVQSTISVKDATQHWDQSRYEWIVEAGKYRLYVSTSSAERDVVKVVELEVTESGSFAP